MIAHVVLFRPKAGLPPEVQHAFADALAAARRDIPSIRRLHLGRRRTIGAAYEAAMPDSWPYLGLVEFDDVAGLQAYLAHPAHDEVGRLFWATSEAVLVLDFEMRDGAEAGLVLEPEGPRG